MIVTFKAYVYILLKV